MVTSARISQNTLEALTFDENNLRITQSDLQVLSSDKNNLRVSQSLLEVLTKMGNIPQNITVTII